MAPSRRSPLGPGSVAVVAVSLREAQLDDRAQLEQLLADYLFEFDGRTGPYPYLDAYWEESDRLPFLIEAEGEVVGLCLIRRRDDSWSIAEFWVIPSQRRGGVGGAAVKEVALRAVRRGRLTLKTRLIPTTA